MFKILDCASVQFARSVGAVISRPLDAAEREQTGNHDAQYTTPAAVAYEWIRLELRQHESLWNIEVRAGPRYTFSPSRTDPLGQRPDAEEPALSVAFFRLADGVRRYMLTFEGEATEIDTIEEVVDRIKSLYARALVEGQ